MKRNVNFFALYLIFVVVLVGFMTIIMHNELKVAFVIISGTLVILQVVGGTFINEQYEEKHKGYAFLSVLPVKEGEIVAAKFLLALITNALFVGFLILSNVTCSAGFSSSEAFSPFRLGLRQLPANDFASFLAALP